MSQSETLQDQIDNHSYKDNSSFIAENYLYLIFVYCVAAAVVGSIIAIICNKIAGEKEIFMIRGYQLYRIDYSLRGVSLLQLLCMMMLFVWITSVLSYWKMIAEFIVSMFGFFSREHFVFRWFVSFIQSLIGQLVLTLVNIVYMVWLADDLKCSASDACDVDKSDTIMDILYYQYATSFFLQCLGIILVALMMMSVGWFFNKRFPRQLNLEQYGIKRPDETASIYDMFPHPVMYEG